MSELHDQIGPFLDGELSPEQAEQFRLHLGTCEACQKELHDLLQLKALAQQARPAPAPVVPLRPRPRWPAAAALVALAALGALVVLRLPRGGAAFELAPTRQLEARLSYADADRYRPYDVARADGARGEARPTLAELAALEERGEARGVAAGHLLRRELAEAEQALAQAPSASAEVASDQAALALARGQPEAALALSARALAQAPGHPQATWNEGLALAALGLPGEAAARFEAVAKLSEPGWSDEARRRAQALEAERQAELSGPADPQALLDLDKDLAEATALGASEPGKARALRALALARQAHQPARLAQALGLLSAEASARGASALAAAYQAEAQRLVGK